jgi:hypothetical protein
MKTITILKPDGTTTEIEGSIVSVSEARQGHPYLRTNGLHTNKASKVGITGRCNVALTELRRFQAMGELPVEENQFYFDPEGDVTFARSVNWKCAYLNAFFPTREAAEQALADFGGWEHLRRVRREFHMVGGV